MPSSGSSHSNVLEKTSIALEEKGEDGDDDEDGSYNYDGDDMHYMSMADNKEKYLGLVTGTKEDLQHIPTLGGKDKEQERREIKLHRLRASGSVSSTLFIVA